MATLVAVLAKPWATLGLTIPFLVMGILGDAWMTQNLSWWAAALASATQVDLSAAHRIDPGHFAGSEEAFRHWDAQGEVPATCAKCHSAGGLPESLANAGTTILSGTTLATTRPIGRRAIPSLPCRSPAGPR